MGAWAVVESNAPLQRVEREPLVPSGSEVVLSVTHAGVCHSDLHFWHGYYDLGGGRRLNLADRGVTLPRAPGHEIVGRVTKLGPDARGVAVGDLCIVYPWLGCGTCDRCTAGDDHLCMKPHAIGVLHDGGFGDEVSVPHPRFLVPVGDIDPAFAATLACSGITVYSAIRKVQPLAPDAPIVLFGAGGLGLQAVSMLRALEHRNIVSVDIAADKRDAALQMGASAAVDGAADGLLDRIMAATGGPVMAAIDFVNTGGTASVGLECLAKAGKLVLVGVGGGQIELSLAGLIFRPRTIQGTVTGNPQDLREVAALAREGRLRPIPLVLMPKARATDALRMLEAGRVRGRIVLTSD
jgi:alcohol dehydrogenase/propanol-preferring alcohol dehydrogenase